MHQQHAASGSQDAHKYASNVRERSMRTSQKPGPLPHEAEVFNGFKQRLKENLMLEQARSLNKEDSIAHYIKKTNELNVFINSSNVPLTDSEEEEQDDGGTTAALGETGRLTVHSGKTTGRKLTEEQMLKREMEVE